jgi:hypothetical protein
MSNDTEKHSAELAEKISNLTPQERDMIAELAARKVFDKAYAEFGKKALGWATFALGLGVLFVFTQIAKDWHPFK